MKNKKINKKRENKFIEGTHLFYPKEFGAYILGTILFSIIALPAGIMNIVLFIKDSHKLGEPFFIFAMLVLGVFPIVIAIYLIITVIELIRKDIYIEINKNYIRIKRFYGEKSINISDIKYVKKISYRMDYFVVSNEFKNIKSKKIKFPTVWFLDNDIFKMVELLKNYRPNIDISSFYTKVLRISFIANKKR